MGVAFFNVIFECGEGPKPMFLYTSIGFISAVLNPTLRNIIPPFQKYIEEAGTAQLQDG
jgi:hypothetical protein